MNIHPKRPRDLNQLAKAVVDISTGPESWRTTSLTVFSDRRDDDFVGLAERAIIRAQIEAWFFRFDASQHQRPAASGARRPQIIDELIFGRLRHWAFIQRPRRWKSESIPHSKTGGQARNITPGAAGGRSWKTSRRPCPPSGVAAARTKPVTSGEIRDNHQSRGLGCNVARNHH
jgi:hypothetical protein